MGPTIPGEDRDVQGRAAELNAQRDAWRFAYDWPVGVATSAELPKSANYTPLYVAESLKTYLAIGANLAAMGLEAERSGELERQIRARFEETDHDGLHANLFTTPKALAESMVDRRPTSWLEFENLFQVWAKPPVVAFFHEDAARLDRAFAWQRIGGVNPMVLARCARIPDNFPVTDAMCVAAAGEGLEGALAEGRVFLADYAALDGLEAGVTDGVQKYLSAPLALFVAKKGSGDLVPVAIQCGQLPGAKNPVWTRSDGWRWRMAVTAVQVADASAHEGLAHLGRTHMVMEAVLVSLHRQLSPRHPLFVLLSAHVDHTAAINHSAKTSLIAPGGTVDRCFAPSIEAFGSVVQKGLASYRLDETAPRDDLRARGLDDRTALPVHPYRDDALPVWDALQGFLTEYVGLYYPTDAAVSADTELAAFVAELGADDGGRLAGVPPARTVAELVFLLTRLVFIAGPQHSAVNFSQFPYMGLPTNMPGASYRPMPDPDTSDTESSLVDMLPSWKIVIEDTTMVYLLSNVRVSTFGHYGLLHFRDPRVLPMELRFHEALARVESAARDRDASRLISYPYLMPSGILQSISI